MKLSWLLVILLLVFVAVFSVQNAEPITVHLLAWKYSASAALVIQLAALLGALVGIVVGSVSARASRRQREQAAADRARRASAELEADRAKRSDAQVAAPGDEPHPHGGPMV